MTSAVLYINAEQVRNVLHWPMVCEAVEEAMKSVAHSHEHSCPGSNRPLTNQPARSMTFCGKKSQILLTMPGYVANYRLTAATNNGAAKEHFSTLGCKLVTSFAGNTVRDIPLPNIMANILLFNSETGKLNCIVDGTDITAWRTAAASIVATKYLYFLRYPEGVVRPIKVAIIGTGVQGESHALGMCSSFTVTDIYLWNRTASKAESLAQELKTKAPNARVHVSKNVADAVINADVICVGTYAQTPLVTHEMIKKNHVHINSVGAGQVHFQEIGPDIYDHAKVYIDSWENAKTELKGLKADIIGEVGEVINFGKYPQEDKITVFQSMGMAAEDVTVAQAVFNAAQDRTD
ncbi:ketimine reductase mu-crystallin isoform X1 [Anastrepha ludens]|uniref:ketimine reductase mu-crystallin isoform X1 n=1 Tax=Anastrepha ludens TaxID=28586 RepID=UPI0023B15930|nr:ketimine reductase mu-crystallin isoform X1 [Anastrepha ludens]